MTDLPTREEAKGILLVRDLMISNNSDAVAIISGYIEGRLIDRTTIDYEAREPAWYTDEGNLVVYAPREGEWFLVSVDAAVKGDT